MKMKIVFVLILFVLLFSSCFTNRVVVSTFDFPNQQNKFVIEQDFDSVWDNVIDFFTSNNLTIKTIEKTSGIIYTDQTEFPSAYWFSDEKKIGNPNAYMAVQYRSDYKKDGTGLKVLASWNVRVKRIDANKTEIAINVGEPTVKANTYIGGGRTSFMDSGLQAKSTGVFEKQMRDYFSK